MPTTMKATFTAFLAGLAFASIASADFLGLVLTDLGDDTFRLSARFDDEDDYVFNVFDTDISNADGWFHFEPFGDIPPQATLFAPEFYTEQAGFTGRDSFVTIGHVPGESEVTPTVLDPNFMEEVFLTGTAFSENAGWFSSNQPSDCKLIWCPPVHDVVLAQFSHLGDAPTVGTLGFIYFAGSSGDPVPVFDLPFTTADATDPADLNLDGTVDGADLGQLLGDWGVCPGCLSDLNDDNIVNGEDLGLLLGAWDGK